LILSPRAKLLLMGAVMGEVGEIAAVYLRIDVLISIVTLIGVILITLSRRGHLFRVDDERGYVGLGGVLAILLTEPFVIALFFANLI
jgi:hypothetical protein